MKKSPELNLILLSLLIINCLSSCKNTAAEKLAEVNPGLLPAQNDTLPLNDKVSNSKILLDANLYRQKMEALCHDSITKKWPVKGPLPLPGALLPFHRVVAYYGNFYSKNMGILGSLPEHELILNLEKEVKTWSKADTTTPTLPAIHYIAITAQNRPGQNNTYRLRMPESQIVRAVNLAKKIKGICFLDIQVGHSTVSKEVPYLEQFLLDKDIHLGLDPEWSMKDGSIPGKKIGTMDASDINFAIEYLSALVKKHQLPPKILVVHRFTKGMITNSDQIKPTPEVQIVINMDGFGHPAKKVDSYIGFVSGYPVQFTGIKLFYKNDVLSKPFRLMTAKEVLSLYPKPIYIQYQ